MCRLIRTYVSAYTYVCVASFICMCNLTRTDALKLLKKVLMSFTKVLLFSKGGDVKTKAVYHGVGFQLYTDMKYAAFVCFALLVCSIFLADERTFVLSAG